MHRYCGWVPSTVSFPLCESNNEDSCNLPVSFKLGALLSRFAGEDCGVMKTSVEWHGMGVGRCVDPALP